LKRLFARLELSGETVGKIAVAKDLGFIEEKRDRRFIKSFSELRNDLVHDIRYVNLTFNDHVKAIDVATLKASREQLRYLVRRRAS
jgi:hypothetical protein